MSITTAWDSKLTKLGLDGADVYKNVLFTGEEEKFASERQVLLDFTLD